MSDFGSEVNNTSIQVAGNVSTKLIEALLALIREIFKALEKNPERQMAKIKLRDIKDQVEKQRLFEKIEGKAGLISHKKLMKAGVPLTATDIYMTKKELMSFSEHCKRQGIIVAMAVNRKEIDSDGSVKYLVECRSSDLRRLKKMIDLMNKEKLMDALEARIKEIESKGEENLTEQDRLEIQDLRRQQEEIRKDYCHELNDEQAKYVSEKAVNGESKSGIIFDEALDRYTSNSLDRDVNYIVADAITPERHIKCHSYNDSFHDKPYKRRPWHI